VEVYLVVGVSFGFFEVYSVVGFVFLVVYFVAIVYLVVRVGFGFLVVYLVVGFGFLVVYFVVVTF
jgi:hypothetical protein